jgi:uncharacterized protein (TIGR02145 family)
LYTWYAINDSRNVCPTGWHLPTDAEWTTLTTYLGGESVAGGKLNETGTTHWQSPNTGATNESGYTALPGGYQRSGTFYYMGYVGSWWSTTESSTTDAYYRHTYYINSNVDRFSGGNKDDGFSVRCLRD